MLNVINKCINQVSFFQESVLNFLTDRQKKVLVVASCAFACLAACYAVYVNADRLLSYILKDVKVEGPFTLKQAQSNIKLNNQLKSKQVADAMNLMFENRHLEYKRCSSY